MLANSRTTKSVLTTLLLAALATSAWADEYTVFTVPGAPTEPSGVAATVIGAGNDDVTQTVDLPFAFPYFGRLQSRLSICSNGWAAFGDVTATVSNNPVLPSTASPDAVLAPLWDDLATDEGQVRTYTNGTAPGRIFYVDWSGVGSFDGSSSGLRFQIALHEGSGAIEFAYGSGGTFSGMSYTAGIEDPTGAVAFFPGGTGNALSARPTGLVRFEPSVVFVNGRLLRDRPVADESGLGNSTETGLPLAGVGLVLFREDSSETAAVGFTGSDGSFSLAGIALEDGVTLAVGVVSAGAGGSVVDASGELYRHTFASALDIEPVVNVGEVTLDADTDAQDATIRRALNIQQAVARGYAVATSAAAWGADNLLEDPQDTIPDLVVEWAPGVGPAGGSTYTPADGAEAPKLTVSGLVGNPDAYDDDVIIREYGQHVLASLSVHPGPLQTPRDFAASTSPEFAWADGFAYFFAAGVQERARLVDTISEDIAVVDDLESPPEGARGVNFPSAVAGSLWELVDAANEPEDEFEGTLGAAPSGFVDVVAHVDRFLDDLSDSGDEQPTVRSFFNIWHAGGTPEEDDLRTSTARAFIHHGTLPDDTAEPNDRIAEASDTAGPGSKVDGLKLSPANRDVFRLVLPGESPQSVEVSLHQTTSVDLTLELLDSEGDVIESTTNQGVGGASRDTLQIQPVPLPPGTYYVRTVPASSETAEYSLSFFRPFLLATGDLPDWTVGVPFKEDLVAAGGVEPYTFATSTDAPGLAVTEAGTRVTGVPTEAGTFDVSVDVSDVAEPQNTIAAVRPLLINPPPTLPTLFGIAEGRDASRLLGTGGTSTEWTPLTQPLGSLSLVGGAELRLVGNSGAPEFFTLSADALDAVGARLDGAPSFVVVTRDITAADDSQIVAYDAFGYFLDALAGSDIDLTLRFRGEGPTPVVTDVLDDAGSSLLTEGLVKSFGRKVKIRDVRARETGRAHVIFQAGDFDGTVRVDAQIKPPRRFRGEEGITASDDFVETTIDALAGAKVRIDLRRLPSPTTLQPTVIQIRQPDGTLMALPTEKRRGGKRAILKFRAEQDGRYTLRFGGRDDTTGPLFFKVKVKTPRSTRLVLD